MLQVHSIFGVLYALCPFWPFHFKYYVIRYCGYSSALAVFGGSELGILPVCTGNIDFALLGLVLLDYVVSVRHNEKNGWLIAGNNKPTIFKVGTVRTYGKRYIC